MHKQLRPEIAQVKELTQNKLNKAIAAANMEAEIAELGFWSANYRRLHKEEFKEEIDEKSQYFAKALTEFESYDLTQKERQTAQAIRILFEKVKTKIAEVVAIEDLVIDERERFIALRVTMDEMLDDQIQPLARQHLGRPRQKAEDAAERAVNTLRTIIPLYVLCAAAISALLVVFIMRPLQRLTKGTEQVGKGDLEHRIPERGTDEFNDVAREFNRMVSQLQATTVNRDLLEESEKKLRDTVAELRREIGERERSEVERFKLSEVLRRKENMAAMGSLVAGVAHEVRNPLFGISASLDAMQARFADRDDLKRYLEVLRGQTQRLTTLMENLLNYGKPFVSEFKPTPVSRTIQEAIEGCSAIAQRSQVEIAFDESGGDSEVLMDEKRLPLVFQNLLENAIQHTPPGGAVQVELAEEENSGGQWVVVKVSDSGPGFSPDDAAQAFAPFFTRRKGGTGLGLSIAQRIVEHHGGKISAANAANGGAVMTVSLPIADSRADERNVAAIRGASGT
ncbi:MAG: ATP-binding protein [Burkholderiales bacterium]